MNGIELVIITWFIVHVVVLIEGIIKKNFKLVPAIIMLIAWLLIIGYMAINL